VQQERKKVKNYPAVNPDANGNAWFINELVPFIMPMMKFMALNFLWK